MRINISRTAMAENALHAVNGAATAHTISGAHTLQALAERVENDLQSRGVPTRAIPGTRVSYIPAGPGKSYSRKARKVISTRIDMVRGATGWFLVRAERYDLWATASETYLLDITVGARNAIVRRAFRNVIGSTEILDKLGSE